MEKPLFFLKIKSYVLLLSLKFKGFDLKKKLGNPYRIVGLYMHLLLNVLATL